MGSQAAVPTAVPVVRAQVVSQQPAPELQSFWHFGGGLFDCMDNGEICCLGFWCPCWVFGKLLQQARLSAQPLFGCCMFALPVLALLIVVGGINQLRLLADVAELCYCPARKTGFLVNARACTSNSPSPDACSTTFNAFRTAGT